MITSIEKLLKRARPAIQRLQAYRSARSLGTDGSVFLDANENPYGEFNRYPDPQPKALRNRLAELYRVAPERLFLGRGTDEAIDVLVRTFCESEIDAILITPPTYGVYEVAANIQGSKVKSAPLIKSSESFLVDEASVLSACTDDVKIVFICSPNNPTGQCVSAFVLLNLAKALEGRTVLVVDEAYIEFSPEKSFLKESLNFSNVIVLRTLSKAWGLAGVRCGVAIGHPEIIGLMQKVRAPYPLSSPTIQAAMEALTPEAEKIMLESVTELTASRETLSLKLKDFPFVKKVHPSDANFILLQVENAKTVLSTCRKKGIIIRDRSSDLGLGNCVRISVGTPKENTALLQAFGEVSDV